MRPKALPFYWDMAGKLTRRGILAGLLTGVAAPALGWAPERSLRPQARARHLKAPNRSDRIVADAGLRGVVAFALADAATGQVLEARNAQRPIPPASVAKAVTAAYALETLGTDYRFRTNVYASGKVANGVLKGDLILYGSGDPVLNTDQLADLARKVRAAGIAGIEGRFLVIGTALPSVDLIDRNQPAHVGYNPSISGLNLNFNRVHFEWKRSTQGYTVTMEARGQRFQPKVAMTRMQIADRRTPVYTYRKDKNADNWTVARGALGNGGARWLPVRHPDLYTGEVFRTVARAQGLLLPAPTLSRSSPRGRVVAQHASPQLYILCRDMLKYSTNLTAEVLGLAATTARQGRPAGLKASGRAMSSWARGRFGMQATFVDHSGLGDASRVTAADMARMLARASSGPLKNLMKPIAMRNSSNEVIKGHPVKVRAKTGTLNFVSGLGGYLTAQDGSELVFAIFAADLDTRAKIRREDRERPQGARPWNRRAKAIQQQLLQSWGTLYGS